MTVEEGFDPLADLAAAARGQAWMDAALCAQADPDAWFPDKGQNPRDAVATCGRCPVSEACLAYALEHDAMGVWGGTTEMQRRHLHAAA